MSASAESSGSFIAVQPYCNITHVEIPDRNGDKAAETQRITLHHRAFRFTPPDEVSTAALDPTWQDFASQSAAILTAALDPTWQDFTSQMEKLEETQVADKERMQSLGDWWEQGGSVLVLQIVRSEFQDVVNQTKKLTSIEIVSGARMDQLIDQYALWTKISLQDTIKYDIQALDKDETHTYTASPTHVIHPVIHPRFHQGPGKVVLEHHVFGTHKKDQGYENHTKRIQEYMDSCLSSGASLWHADYLPGLRKDLQKAADDLSRTLQGFPIHVLSADESGTFLSNMSERHKDLFQRPNADNCPSTDVVASGDATESLF